MAGILRRLAFLAMFALIAAPFAVLIVPTMLWAGACWLLGRDAEKALLNPALEFVATLPFRVVSC